ncbi:MAG: hypothetical protein K2N48_07355 [Muribaculaceae bacterium]|nr:hypothetical protein [Muribaculaceae bacterium]
MYQSKPHEKTFQMQPIGVAYTCEICNEGEMIDAGDPRQMLMSNPPKMGLIRHICNKCGAEMKLPQSYPRIEWTRVDE